jgi:hypothetical protein
MLQEDVGNLERQCLGRVAVGLVVNDGAKEDVYSTGGQNVQGMPFSDQSYGHGISQWIEDGDQPGMTQFDCFAASDIGKDHPDYGTFFAGTSAAVQAEDVRREELSVNGHKFLFPCEVTSRIEQSSKEFTELLEVPGIANLLVEAQNLFNHIIVEEGRNLLEVQPGFSGSLESAIDRGGAGSRRPVVISIVQQLSRIEIT